MSDLAGFARSAARTWDLPEPVLVRTGMNALFQCGDEVMLRVGRPSYAPSADASWHDLMSSIDVRVPRLLHHVQGPDGLVAVAVERVHAAGPVDWTAVGAMVRRLHALDPGSAPGLPWCGDFPHWQIDALLREVRPDIDHAAAAGLQAGLDRWPAWRERLAEQVVVCHGDVHPGNVLQAVDGPVLIDWDLRCLAPVAWDHGPLMTWTERWGGPDGMYEAFADGYGRSLRGDASGECLAELRNLVATLLRVRAGRTDAAARAEAERRLQWWRGDPSAPVWTAQ